MNEDDEPSSAFEQQDEEFKPFEESKDQGLERRRLSDAAVSPVAELTEVPAFVAAELTDD